MRYGKFILFPASPSVRTDSHTNMNICKYIRSYVRILLNDEDFRWVGIHLHRKSIAHNGLKTAYANATTHKASSSIARNGATSFNVHR